METIFGLGILTWLWWSDRNIARNRKIGNGYPGQTKPATSPMQETRPSIHPAYPPTPAATSCDPTHYTLEELNQMQRDSVRHLYR